MIEIALAKPEDFTKPPPYRARAIVVKKDGRVIGIGGLGFPPHMPPVLWSDISDELRALPVTLHRTGLRFIDEARAQGVRVMYATTDAEFEAAERWIRRLGFEHTGEVQDGKKVWVWRDN